MPAPLTRMHTRGKTPLIGARVIHGNAQCWQSRLRWQPKQAPNQHDMHMLRMGNAHGCRKQRSNKSVQVASSARHGSRHHDMKHVRKRRLGLDASRNEEACLNRRPDATMTAVGKIRNNNIRRWRSHALSHASPKQCSSQHVWIWSARLSV